MPAETVNAGHVHGPLFEIYLYVESRSSTNVLQTWVQILLYSVIVLLGEPTQVAQSF